MLFLEIFLKLSKNFKSNQCFDLSINLTDSIFLILFALSSTWF